MWRRGLRCEALARLFVILLWFSTCINEFNAVKITKIIVVPEIIQFGVQETVILDCEFLYGNLTNGLMVKWFFRNKTRPVYQWIFGQKPQDLGILRNRVDLSYRASNDPYTMYRAMRIVKPNTDISGEYTCVVSTFWDEDQRTKALTVFAPETNFQLIHNKTNDDTVNVICAVEGAFPLPNVTLSTPSGMLPSHQQTPKLAKGRYSAVTTITLKDADLPTPAVFICTLRIPQAIYITRKESLYYPGPISTTPEMPTAADMQQAAAVGSRGKSIEKATVLTLLSIFSVQLSSA